jgi:O-antigen/teichoic acid export membrane protein
MAEFLGMGDRGTARFIYWRTLLLQTALATIATSGLLFWVIRDAVGDYKLASVFIVLSIWPSMVNSISSQANAASENFAANVPASLVSALTYFFAIVATVVFKWGVTGVGASLLCMRAVDFLFRFFPTIKRVLGWNATHIHPAGLSKRMIPFAWQSVVSMAVALVVWNRSEVVLLGKFCADIRQVAYYSIAFSMADQLLLGATIFGSATGATIFAQYGRDKSKLPELVATAFRYLALTSIPLHFIFAALAAPALLIVYGKPYAGAAMVVTLAPLLCLPKAFVAPAQNLLESMEKQRFVIMSTALASIVDISVAWYLIPAHGAVGACIGSGTAQVIAVGMMWIVGIHLYKVKLPWRQVAKIVFISLLAALTAHYIAIRMTPWWAILCGGSAALAVFFSFFYLMRVGEPNDHDRLKILVGMLPKVLVRPAGRVLSSLFGRNTRPNSRQGSFVGAPLVLLITYYFPPDNEIGAARPYRFYKYLNRLGYECHILTAAAQEPGTTDVEYVADPQKSDARTGFTWHLDRIVRKYFWGSSFKLRWSISAFRAGRLFLKERKDREIILISTTPPVATHLVAMCLAAYSGRRWIADFRDPVISSFCYQAFLVRAFAPGFGRLVLRRADLALANTDAMLNVWHNQYSGLDGKAHVLWNGFDPEDVVDTYALPQRERKILSHIGELYGGRDMRPLLLAAARLFESGRLSKKSLTIRQIGTSQQSELPGKEFLQFALPEGWLEIRDPVSAKQARSMALDSDGLLLLQPQTDIQVPAKLFEYLRVGRPILAYVVPDSPSERILRKAGVPFVCIYPGQAPNEIEQRLLSFIAMLDGRPTSYSPWFAETFDASRQVKTLDDLIRSLMC